ncbi:HutD family protein [Pseudarthrobacter chlorophenolicus]|uniref:HutD/Ves family protein n=1 Tax=Pseudarthrobacter chlorophenolicus TaxID=85085 RepID=UPI0005F2C5F4|nr:HutD family protein [Pseudarthrobacter chlorophenolicus]
MQIIRFAELKAKPWRNGGGTTREILSGPADQPADAPAGRPDSWGWRISLADVTKAGDFSAFPGCERVLTVVEGDLLLLSVDGSERPVEKYRPFRFDGGAPTIAALPTGDIRNLNVITRSDAFKGYASVIEISKKRAHPVFAGQVAVLLQGQATVGDGAGGSAELARYDAVVGSDDATPEVTGRGFLAVVSIDPAAD